MSFFVDRSASRRPRIELRKRERSETRLGRSTLDKVDRSPSRLGESRSGDRSRSIDSLRVAFGRFVFGTNGPADSGGFGIGKGAGTVASPAGFDSVFSGAAGFGAESLDGSLGLGIAVGSADFGWGAWEVAVEAEGCDDAFSTSPIGKLVPGGKMITSLDVSILVGEAAELVAGGLDGFVEPDAC